MVAHHDGNSVPRGLDDIVSTTGDEAATNEGHVGQSVKGREFAYRINQQDAADYRIAAPQETSPEPDSKFFQQFGHVAEPFRMARRHDHHGARVTGEYIREGLQQ